MEDIREEVRREVEETLRPREEIEAKIEQEMNEKIREDAENGVTYGAGAAIGVDEDGRPTSPEVKNAKGLLMSDVDVSPARELSKELSNSIAGRIDTDSYQEFAETKLGFRFHNVSLLVTALTHRSYVNEHKLSGFEHNERLEYLGDAVLEVVSSDFLFRNINEQEGVLTALRAALVRTESIGQAGDDLGYGPLIRLSKGEQHGTDRAHEVIMADCFEALIGAIYLDQGFAKAKAFIDKHILSKLDEVIQDGTWRDAKSYMQELSQKVAGTTPIYHTLREEGPDHNKTFVVGLYVGEELIGMGEGHSKQDAQVMAARMGVKKYRRLAVELGVEL